MTQFHLKTPTLDNNWRSIILFGRNVASYKFALAKTLLECAGKTKTELSLAEIAPAFSLNICEHLQLSDRQATSPRSRFLDSCRAFNRGDIDTDELVGRTVRIGFNNVIDAFHIVNGAPIETRFFIDERSGGGGIRLTDDLYRLYDTHQSKSLGHEVEARWRLVETAWSLNIGQNLITVQADHKNDLLFIGGARRIDITSSRSALNGYQKGRCFYCYDEISVNPDHHTLADVDHFFPWVLKNRGFVRDVDGVWNLVLACRSCNRSGKQARVPALKFLKRLHQRNSYLIDSHHPLRETLIQQTGRTEPSRRDFLERKHNEARSALIHLWDTQPRAEATF